MTAVIMVPGKKYVSFYKGMKMVSPGRNICWPEPPSLAVPLGQPSYIWRATVKDSSYTQLYAFVKFLFLNYGIE